MVRAGYSILEAIMKTQIIDLKKLGYSYQEIADKLKVTRSVVAGIIWRHKNPGMWKKNIKSGEKRKWYKKS